MYEFNFSLKLSGDGVDKTGVLGLRSQWTMFSLTRVNKLLGYIASVHSI